jgi:hypothetical protein
MIKCVRSAAVAGTVLVSIASGAIAVQPADPNGNNCGNCNGNNGNGFGNIGVPGPIAGAGLPFLLLAGGYAVSRYRRQNRQ